MPEGTSCSWLGEASVSSKFFYGICWWIFRKDMGYERVKKLTHRSSISILFRDFHKIADLYNKQTNKMHSFLRVVIIMYCKLRGLNNRNVFYDISSGYNSQIKVLAKPCCLLRLYGGTLPCLFRDSNNCPQSLVLLACNCFPPGSWYFCVFYCCYYES